MKVRKKRGSVRTPVLKKQLESLRRRNRQTQAGIQKLIEALSHDSRSPIATICTLSKLLLDGYAGPVPSSFQNVMASILRGAQSSLKNIDLIYQILKLKGSAYKLEIGSHPLPGLLEDAYAPLRRRFELKQIVLDWSQVPASVFLLGDLGVFHKIFTILFTKILSWSPPNSRVELHAEEIEAHRADDVGKLLKISADISDERIRSMDPKKFFSRYRAFPASEGHLHANADLNVARSLCRLHRGNFWITQELPQRLSFRICLPFLNKV